MHAHVTSLAKSRVVRCHTPVPLLPSTTLTHQAPGQKSPDRFLGVVGGRSHCLDVAVVLCKPFVLGFCHDGSALPSAIRPHLDDYTVEVGARIRSTPKIETETARRCGTAPLESAGAKFHHLGAPARANLGQGIALRGSAGGPPAFSFFLGARGLTVFERAVDA